LCTVHPLAVHQKMNMGGIEKTKKKGGGGGEKENILSKHNFNLKQVCTKAKHVHLISFFLQRRKPVTHDVDASRALQSIPSFNGSAPGEKQPQNILLMLQPLNGQQN